MGCVYGKCCKRRHVKASESGFIYPRKVGEGIPVFAERPLECISVPSDNFCLEYSVLTQRGYYPDSPEKENQDSYCIITQLQDNPNIHFFGVFDGHGQWGTQCSNFVKDKLVEILSSDTSLLQDPVKAYNDAFLSTNKELHDSDIDDAMSGTTAITALVIGNMLYVANVGDSRAVIARKNENQIIAQDLSCDQTPFRKDEYDRVRLCGARVLSVDQIEGSKDPNVQTWGDEETEGGDPPRLWVQNGIYPGTAFTRSLGDSTAETIGVIAAPEVSLIQLAQEHLFLVIASDGVFEFLPSQAVVDMVYSYQDPRDACSAIVAESYKLWLTHENRTDDISVIIVYIRSLSSSNTGPVSSEDSKADVVRVQNKASDISVMSSLSLKQSAGSSLPDQHHFHSSIAVDQSSHSQNSLNSQPT